MNRFCERASKRCFASKKEARRAMRRLSAKLRVYVCEHCSLWHLTSQTHHQDLTTQSFKQKRDDIRDTESQEEIDNA